MLKKACQYISFLIILLCNVNTSSAEIKQLKILRKEIKVHVAITIEELTKGLIGIEKIEENEGMLFILPFEYKHCMTTKDMKIPVDIAFINKNMHITNIETGIPGETNKICASTDVKYAIEMNKDWFAKNNIRRGYEVLGIK